MTLFGYTSAVSPKRMKIENYELLEMFARDRDLETYKARDLSTSKTVILHKLVSFSSAEAEHLRRLVKMAITSGRANDLLFAGELENTMCLVMEPRQDCYDVRKWLARHANGESAPGPEVSVPPPAVPLLSPVTPPAKASDAGEFTTFFRKAPDKVVAQPVVPQPEVAEKPVVPAPPAPEPGEFTRMFNVKDLNAPAAEGDFTRMFGKLSPAPPSPQSLDSSDFTKLFAKLPAPSPAAPSVPQPSMMDSVPTSTPAADPGEFTRIFGTPAPTTPIQPAKEAAPVPAPEPVRQAPESPPAPPVVSRQESKKPSYLPLILILAGLVVAVVILVLYFTLKRT
jgi:hypothetical protein